MNDNLWPVEIGRQHQEAPPSSPPEGLPGRKSSTWSSQGTTAPMATSVVCESGYPRFPGPMEAWGLCAFPWRGQREPGVIALHSSLVLESEEAESELNAILDKSRKGTFFTPGSGGAILTC